MALRPCVIEGCDGIAGKPGSARGWCHAHYRRWQRHGDPLVVSRKRHICAIDDCVMFVKSDGWCSMHHSRFLRHGSPTARLKGEVVNGCRVCPGCGLDKPLSEWGRNRTTNTGFSAYCKPCMRKIQGDHRAGSDFVRSPRDPAKDREYARRWRVANPGLVRMYGARYRAMKVAATTERFLVEEIFERDGWICHICDLPIDSSLKSPDGGSASLDHVIPLSRGGAHSRANCAASHLVCNIRKKDRTGVGRGVAHLGCSSNS